MDTRHCCFMRLAAWSVLLTAIIWSAPAVAQEKTVELLLRVSPADTEVTLDGKGLELTEGGSAVLARVTPGRHVLVVKKDGHARLEKILDVPADGLEGKVHLAPVLQQVTVYMKSGRKMEGALVAKDGGKITITRGKGKLTLSKGMYERIEVGEESAAGESTIEIISKTSAISEADKESDARKPVAKGEAESQAEPAAKRELKGSRGKLPRALKKAFMLPDSDNDQHGNPVMGGQRTCQ